MQTLASFALFLPPGSAIGAVEPVFPRIERNEDDVGSQHGTTSKKTQIKQKTKKELAMQEETLLLERARSEYGNLEVAAMESVIAGLGDEVRTLKSQGADKALIMDKVGMLRGLKALFTAESA